MMFSFYGFFTQLLGFLGAALFFASYQAKSNKRLFVLQTVGCLAFCVQFALLGAYSGCLSLLINLVRNLMLTKYNESALIRWKGWALLFSAASVASATLTWEGWISLLPVIGTVSGAVSCWTNNARTIRVANLTLNAPFMLVYDLLVRSWGGALNESVTILSIVISIFRFGWDALDGDRVAQ